MFSVPVVLCPRCLLGLGAALLSASCAAGSATASAVRVGVGEAEVREGAAGIACFTIAEREERRSGAPNFEAISVTDVSSTPRAVVWSMAMPAGRTFPLTYSMCVPYGGRVPALPQRSAEVLEAGKLYEVAIAVRVDAVPAPPRSLVARFCLLRQADGGNRIGQAGACAAPPARPGKR